ncbi:MAG: hypothetical protein OXC44_01960 [Proteobacteria bacterium]|nr:hypothetical protein [Pseudomonadota bacterium]
MSHIHPHHAINIVGLGRLGGFFQHITQGKGYSRNCQLSSLDPSRPTLLCVRIDQLHTVLSQLPTQVTDKLIFLQNGIYDDILLKHHITSPTQLLIYFAIASKGHKPQDGKKSVITGPYSHIMENIFHYNDLSLKLLDQLRYRQCAYEKLIWLSAFGLLCDIYNTSVTYIVTNHKPALEKLSKELCSIIYNKQKITLEQGWLDRLCSYSLSLGHYTASLKEYPYRNGWFVKQQHTPYHMALLQKLKENH